jgi:hypothetical protein
LPYRDPTTQHPRIHGDIFESNSQPIYFTALIVVWRKK